MRETIFPLKKVEMGKQPLKHIWARFFRYLTDFFSYSQDKFFLPDNLNSAVRSDLAILHSLALFTKLPVKCSFLNQSLPISPHKVFQLKFCKNLCPDDPCPQNSTTEVTLHITFSDTLISLINVEVEINVEGVPKLQNQ